MRNQDELRSAVATASPGAVIAVDGMFEATGIEIQTADLTLTCATPGSGLRAPFGFMPLVFAPRVTVERLTLDASAAQAYLAHQGGPSAGHAEDIRLIGNTIICGAAPFCVVYGSFPGGPVAQGALVVGNRFTATGSESALHFHGVAGGRVEGNTFLGAGATQGIRVQGEAGLVISDNVLAGSWEDPLVLEFTEGSQILANTVTCGPSTCLFGFGTRGIVVADNHFQSGGSFTGVQLQQSSDGARVERNTIVATAPSTGPFHGAIRIHTARSVVVSGNSVRGPWQNSLSPANLSQSTIERNLLEGAVAFGVRFSTGTPDVEVSMIGNLVRDNQIQVGRTASGGILVDKACNNVFVGNSLGRHGRTPGVIFEERTGANVLVLLSNVDVIDNGQPLDCNGDGLGDPNIITGPGRVQRGVAVGASAVIETDNSSKLR